MDWVAFTYSLPTQLRSSPRVALWRRLRRLGAVSPAGGVQILPARDECLEAFHWLAQEIRHARGEALVMRVQEIEGITDGQLVEMFCQARQDEYAEIDLQAAELERAIRLRKKHEPPSDWQEAFAKLRRRHAEIARVDYFECPAGMRVAARLARLELALSPNSSIAVNVPPALAVEYRDKLWVTRPQPHVDRLACAWLIRRFINAQAIIRYAARPKAGEIAFDMDEGMFGHQGSLCTFETMTHAFGLDEPGLRALSQIVHQIDLRDGRYARPEAAGIEAVLHGWRQADLSDTELESRGIALFEGLYKALSGRSEQPRARRAAEPRSKRRPRAP